MFNLRKGMLGCIIMVWLSFMFIYSNRLIQVVQINNTADIDISQTIQFSNSSQSKWMDKNPKKHQEGNFDKYGVRKMPSRSRNDASHASHKQQNELGPMVLHDNGIVYPYDPLTEHQQVDKQNVEHAMNNVVKSNNLQGIKYQDKRNEAIVSKRDVKLDVLKLEEPFKGLTLEEIKQRKESIQNARFSLFLRKERNEELQEYIKNNFNATSGADTGINEVDDYFRVRDTRINPHDYRFIHNGHKICADKPPWLLVMVLSVAHKAQERAAIRQTWGSVVHGDIWPGTKRSHGDVKIMFIFGKSKNRADDATLQEERDIYGDIVQADFVESYKNLTTKVMMGIKWTTHFCSGVKFLFKVDDDSFLHVPNALRTLKPSYVPSNGGVFGNLVTHPVVLRESKWALPHSLFPFKNYPLYTSGSAYAISGNILSKIFTTGEYLPYIFIEDAFITGIVRTIIGASITPLIGYPQVFMGKSKPCSFHNNIRVAATNISPVLMKEIWKSLSDDTITDCYMCLSEHC